MYMENLEEWVLEEDKVVTYKYLSRNLKVHVNVAKQMLFNFVQSRQSSGDKLGVVYLMSGLVPAKGGEDAATAATCQKVVLVKEQDRETVRAKFSELLSEHVYSVQKSAEGVAVTSLFLADKSQPGQDFTAAAALTAVKHKAAVPREAVMVAAPSVKKEVSVKKEEAKKEKEPVKKSAGIEAAFSKTSNKKSSPEKTAVVKKPAQTSKGKSSISSMFAKQASKPKPVKTAAEEKENIVNQKIEEAAVETEEVKVKNEPKSLPANNSKKSRDDDSKKRKRIQVMSDSEEEEDDQDETNSEKPPEEEEEAPPVSKLIESDDEEIPATPVRETKTSKTGRRRVRKLVDKTYMDSKGYMVTKKEYESASETDEETEPVKKTSPKKQDKVEPPVTKKPKLTNSGNKGQAGIMNFFKKK